MNTDADAQGFGQIVLEIFVEFFQARSHPGARN
jgi:hypothetical protein